MHISKNGQERRFLGINSMVRDQVLFYTWWGNSSNGWRYHSKPNVNDANSISKLGAQRGGLTLGNWPAVKRHAESRLER